MIQAILKLMSTAILSVLFLSSACWAVSSLTVTASSSRQWTGVAVSSQGRLFVNYPHWSTDVPVSVAEIVNGEAVPYPNPAWNNRAGSQSFNAVQSVVIDAKNRLWVLDTNNPRFTGVQAPGPVLFQFDLKTNRKVKAFTFPKGVWQANSYFNDVRIDTHRKIAYLTDSGNGALIVLDLRTGNSRRLLDTHSSTKSEDSYLVCDGQVWKNSVDSDGIALSLNRSHLYYIALTGHTLYRIETDALLDESLSSGALEQKVEKVAAIPATDGMMFDDKGNLWLGGLENNSINMINTKGDLIQMTQGPDIRWADSFAKDNHGNIYFTTSQIHLPENKRGLYLILKLSPGNLENPLLSTKL